MRGQLRLWRGESEPSLSESERWAERAERRLELEARDDTYVSRPHTPRPPAAGRGRRPLAIAKPPKRVAEMTRAEREEWALWLVKATRKSIEADGDERGGVEPGRPHA
jgi:hypothetical protein